MKQIGRPRQSAQKETSADMQNEPYRELQNVSTPNVPTAAQRAAALISDACLQLQRQDGEAFQDAAAILQSAIPFIEGMDRGGV